MTTEQVLQSERVKAAIEDAQRAHPAYKRAYLEAIATVAASEAVEAVLREVVAIQSCRCDELEPVDDDPFELIPCVPHQFLAAAMEQSPREPEKARDDRE